MNKGIAPCIALLGVELGGGDLDHSTPPFFLFAKAGKDVSMTDCIIDRNYVEQASKYNVMDVVKVDSDEYCSDKLVRTSVCDFKFVNVSGKEIVLDFKKFFNTKNCYKRYQLILNYMLLLCGEGTRTFDSKDDIGYPRTTFYSRRNGFCNLIEYLKENGIHFEEEELREENTIFEDWLVENSIIEYVQIKHTFSYENEHYSNNFVGRLEFSLRIKNKIFDQNISNVPMKLVNFLSSFFKSLEEKDSFGSSHITTDYTSAANYVEEKFEKRLNDPRNDFVKGLPFTWIKNGYYSNFFVKCDANEIDGISKEIGVSESFLILLFMHFYLMMIKGRYTGRGRYHENVMMTDSLRLYFNCLF